jgi:hypothetical protein
MFVSTVIRVPNIEIIIATFNRYTMGETFVFLTSLLTR